MIDWKELSKQIRQALPDAFTHRQTVDDYGKAVLFVFLQWNQLQSGSAGQRFTKEACHGTHKFLIVHNIFLS